MHITDTVQRVRIYLNEADDVGGRPLYLATLDMLREAGATGATALRGIAGFGVSQRLRTEHSEGGRGLPILIEWIDRAERVARVLAALDTLLPNALITLEPVQIYRATLRSSGPFGERAVGDLVQHDVVTITPQHTLADALDVLLKGTQDVLPVVVEPERRMVGAIREAELRRQGLTSLARMLVASDDERTRLLANVGATPLAEIMATEVLSLTADSSVQQAASAMVEWGLNQVPVISRDGRFAGLFGVDQVLQAALEARAPSDGPIRDADGLAPLGLLMQGVIHTIQRYAPVADAIKALQAARTQPLLVVDGDRPLGVLDPVRLVQNTSIEARPQLAALLDPATSVDSAAFSAAWAGEEVGALPLAPLPRLASTARYDQAIAVLRDQEASWVAVVDDVGRLQGLVGRRTLLRALVQESGR